jgi:hypothetical protein
MNPIPFIILAVIVTIVIGFILITRWSEKKSRIKRQKTIIDPNIERLMIEEFSRLTMVNITEHSNHQKIARLISARIIDEMRLGIHPKQLSNIFKNLGLFYATQNNWSNEEIALSAMIQQYVLRSIDSHDLKVYEIHFSENKKQGLEELNRSFLMNAENNGLIWDLKLD